MRRYIEDGMKHVVLTVGLSLVILAGLGSPLFQPMVARALAPAPSIDTQIRLLNMHEAKVDRLSRLFDQINEHYPVPVDLPINVLAPERDKTPKDGMYFLADASPRRHGVYTIRVFPRGLEQSDEALSMTLVHELEHVRRFEEGLGMTRWNGCALLLHQAFAHRAEIVYARKAGYDLYEVKPGVREQYQFAWSEANRLCVQDREFTPWLAALAISRNERR